MGHSGIAKMTLTWHFKDGTLVLDQFILFFLFGHRSAVMASIRLVYWQHFLLTLLASYAVRSRVYQMVERPSLCLCHNLIAAVP